MGFWYVQKWIIKQDKVDEHEKLLKKILDQYNSLWPEDMKRFKYFAKWYGPGNSRIGILTGFESLEQFEKDWEKWNSDEKISELNKEWRTTVVMDSWHAEFWGKIPLEKKKK